MNTHVSFGGLELIRTCNILPCDQIDFGIDLCAIFNVLPKTPPQEPQVNLVTHGMLFYNGLLSDADVAEMDPLSVVIDDRTSWAGFIDPTPTQVLVFRTPLQFVLHSWYDVGELAAEALPRDPRAKPSMPPVRGGRK